MKLTQFHQCSMRSFFVRRSRKHKETVKLSVFLSFLDMRVQKQLAEHWWNWHQKSISSTFYAGLFCTKVLFAAFSSYSLALLFFSTRIFAQKLLIKCWWNLPLKAKMLDESKQTRFDSGSKPEVNNEGDVENKSFGGSKFA